MNILNKWVFAGFAFIVSAVFVSCSDDENTQPVAPIFSEPLDYECEGNSKDTIEFVSETDWKLVSSSIWCTLSLDGELFSYDVSGKAGKNSVTFMVTDDGQSFEETVAKLTLIREGASEVIAIVRRGSKEHELKVYDADGNISDKIDIDNSGMVTFNVEANFGFAVVEQPEWLDELIVSYDNGNQGKATYIAMVKEEFEPCPAVGTIRFANEDSSIIHPCDVVYPGMDEKRIEISGVNDAYMWTLSTDGTTFTKDTSEYAGAMEYTVKSLNYKSRFICLEENDNLLVPMDDSWIKVTVDENDSSRVYITGEAYPAETEGSRKAYVFAVPDALYDDFMSEYSNMTPDEFIPTVANNVMLEVTQASDYVDLTNTFVVKNYNQKEIQCIEESDQDILALINEKYPVKNGIYSVTADVGTSLTAESYLTDDEWVGYDENNTVVIDTQGNELPFSDAGIELVIDKYYTIMFKVTAKSYIVILKGVDGEYLKALVVKPGISLEPGTGFDVKYMMTSDVPCSLETDMDITESIVERYGVKEIYSVTYDAGRKICVFPHLSEEIWIPGSLDSFILADTEGNTIDWQKAGFECWPHPTKTTEYGAAIDVQPFTMILVFVDADGKNRKAIVIKPKTE